MRIVLKVDYFYTINQMISSECETVWTKSSSSLLAKVISRRQESILIFLFWDGDGPRSTSYGVNISQLTRFARASSHVADLNTLNKMLTQKLLKEGYQYQQFCKTFSKFYR